MTLEPSSPVSASPVVKVQNVSKWFGPLMALNGISLEINPGITGLVGPNGAGKTTLLRLLTGQSKPSIGGIRICEYNAWSAKAKSHIGFCPYGDAAWDEMSGRKAVRVSAGLHGFNGEEARRRTETVLDIVGMIDRANLPIRTYSKGMRQRIKLGQALIHDPDLLVLDEPFCNLDLKSNYILNKNIKKLINQSINIIYITHNLDSILPETNRVILMKKGKIINDGNPNELINTKILSDLFNISINVIEQEGYWRILPLNN